MNNFIKYINLYYITSIFLFVFLTGCSSESITKNGITYSDKEDYKTLKQAGLINNTIFIRTRALAYLCKRDDNCKIKKKEIFNTMLNQVRELYPDYSPVDINMPNQTLQNNADYAVMSGGMIGGLMLMGITGIAELWTKNQDSINKKAEKDPKVQFLMNKARNKFYELYNQFAAYTKITYVSISDFVDNKRLVKIDMTIIAGLPGVVHEFNFKGYQPKELPFTPDIKKSIPWF